MRLFLASASVRGRVRALTALVGSNARVGVSANALDMEAEGERTEWLQKEMRALRSAGLSPVEFDLRRYDTHREAVVEALDRLDMVWATGGNVFVLRQALRRTQVDALLSDRLRDDTLAYGGCSAGACVCGPTLRGFELIDDAHAAGPPIFDGLALVGYSVVPHAGSTVNAPLVTYLERAQMPYRELRDGQAIVVDDERSALVEFY